MDMVDIKVLSGEAVELKEEKIKNAFEKNLKAIEDGLEYVASEVTIGVGRIDTLAIDEKNRPVIIEYKRGKSFDKDALVQLMDYLSWFVKDETHILSLEKLIKQKNPNIKSINPEIKVILVSGEVDERVKNACFVIQNPVKIVTYTLLKDEKGSIILTPRMELDNTQRITPTPPIISEEEILNKNKRFVEIYRKIKNFITNLAEVESPYTISGEVVRFRRSRGKVFANIWFARRWLSLEIFVGEGVESDRFKYWKDSPWGYVRIGKDDEIDDEVKEWIKKAHENALS